MLAADLKVPVAPPVPGFDPRPTTTCVDPVAHLYGLHHAEITRFLARRLRNDELANDLAQDAFVALIRQVEGAGMPLNVRAWLIRVASNLAISHARRESTARRKQYLLADREVTASAEELSARRERGAELHRALDTLTMEGRLALLLTANGFTPHEIALAMRRSAGATRTLICRNRQRVRHHLQATADGEMVTAFSTMPAFPAPNRSNDEDTDASPR
jgi:RNA polymerase sigma-70 factor (ECF subfamily)